MYALIVVDNPKKWSLKLPSGLLVSAWDYLTNANYAELRGVRVFNLCRSYRYQSAGYYVSLLAMARGHKALPSISAIQDMKSSSMIRIASEELDDLIQQSMRHIKSPHFTLSVYFGHNPAKRYEELCSRLFRMFQAPFLRAEFAHEDDAWRLRSLKPIAASAIPEGHEPFVIDAAAHFFAQKRFPTQRRSVLHFDLAILHNPNEPFKPSDAPALRKFIEAGKRQRIAVELIEREDYGRLAEFDALFIRETTAVNHHTFRFARKAAAEGLVVIDDPESITKCTNKVYLAELLDQHNIEHPKTLIVHGDNVADIPRQIGFPCILKRPDSSFSQGVIKVENGEQLADATAKLLDDSELIIAQEFIPTPFDWRITILDRWPLFACKYHMAPQHWQIARTDASGTDYGRVEPVPLEHVSTRVVKTAVRAANLIGDGFYGVDLKEINKHVYVIEINDNPNLDAGQEDRILKNELYDRIMRVFATRIQQRRNGSYQA